MTNRILLGLKGSVYGLWVSKPGINVVSAADSDMLLSIGRKQLQVVKSGMIANPGVANTDITMPNLGFNPMVFVHCVLYRIEYSFPNSTTLRIRTWAPRATAVDTSGNVFYAITNMKLPI